MMTTHPLPLPVLGPKLVASGPAIANGPPPAQADAPDAKSGGFARLLDQARTEPDNSAASGSDGESPAQNTAREKTLRSTHARPGPKSSGRSEVPADLPTASAVGGPAAPDDRGDTREMLVADEALAEGVKDPSPAGSADTAALLASLAAHARPPTAAGVSTGKALDAANKDQAEGATSDSSRRAGEARIVDIGTEAGRGTAALTGSSLDAHAGANLIGGPVPTIDTATGRSANSTIGQAVDPASGALGATASARTHTNPANEAARKAALEAGSDVRTAGDAMAAATAAATDDTRPGADSSAPTGGRSFASELQAALGMTLSAPPLSGAPPSSIGTATPSAAPATLGQLTTSPGSPGFGPELGAQLATFVREGVHHARLELNPAAMGPLTVQIQLEGQTAQVHLAAQNAETRQALEQAMPTLAGSLREAGLTLSGGGVFEQPRQPQPDASAGNRGGAANGEDTGDHDRGLAAQPLPTPPRRRGVVDLVA